jgi:SAM-dependent methyltransferase
MKPWSCSGYSAPGFAARYDANRPRPPEILLELVPQLAGVAWPRLVVDLGSGSGPSTRFWAWHAESVVGVEPNDEMRRFAESLTAAGNVSYVGASAYETGLPVSSADIITCSQSLQWMDPELVFPEIRRILRPGGVFAAFDRERWPASRERLAESGGGDRSRPPAGALGAGAERESRAALAPRVPGLARVEVVSDQRGGRFARVRTAGSRRPRQGPSSAA